MLNLNSAHMYGTDKGSRKLETIRKLTLSDPKLSQEGSIFCNFSLLLFLNFSINSFSKHRPSGPMLSISRNIRLSVCPSVRLFTFEIPFKSLFVPTSQIRISNVVRDLESMGKSNEKKWSQI